MKRTHFLLSFLLTALISLPLSAASKDYWFFSKEDIKVIRMASNTEWGQQITGTLKRSVAKRLKNPLDAPVSEGGYKHHYFCPVHDTEFVFDWKKPTEHYCKLCGKYYTGVKKYDMAWIDNLHKINMSYLTSCTFLYLITGEPEYAGYISDMLYDYSTHYPDYKEHAVRKSAFEESAGKMFSQSLDESIWMAEAARAFVTVKKLIPKSQQESIRSRLFAPAAELIKRKRKTNNWQTWHNCALASLGVALEDDELIKYALESPTYGFTDVLDKNLMPDGWWGEGSVSYHFYPLRAMILTAEAVRCRGINLYDERIYSMFDAPVRGTYSNLDYVAHNDGWYGTSLTSNARLYGYAYRRYNKDSLFASVCNLCMTGNSKLKGHEWLFCPDVTGEVANICQESSVFEHIGYAVLRSGKNSAVMKFGPHGGWHGHPDKLSITLHDGEKEILPDLGSPAYGVPDHKLWYKKTIAHNTVTVDGEDQLPSTGKLVKFENRKDGGYIEAVADSAYNSVMMRRSLDLSPSGLTDVYTCTSDSIHTYDYVLLLREDPTITQQGLPAQDDGRDGYAKISEMKEYDSTGEFYLETSSGKIKISTPGSAKILVGRAKGPAQKKETSNVDQLSLCWPVIVRTIGQNMEVKVNWMLK
jgi:hypothetical protein